MRRRVVVVGSSVVLVVFGALLAFELLHRRETFTRGDLAAFAWLHYNDHCDTEAPAAKPEEQPPASDRRLVVLAGGCWRMWAKPSAEKAVPGKAYPHHLDFHCSVDPTEFDGSFWYFQEIEIDKKQAPPGLQTWDGSMTLTEPDTAEFTTADPEAPILRFRRHTGSVVVAPCS